MFADNLKYDCRRIELHEYFVDITAENMENSHPFTSAENTRIGSYGQPTVIKNTGMNARAKSTESVSWEEVDFNNEYAVNHSDIFKQICFP